MKKPQIAGRLAKRSGVSKAAAADQLDRVVNDILSQLRSGQAAPLPGLVIAGILAATMSTLSSGLNSLCTVTMVDFYKRLRGDREGGEASVATARWFTLAWGIAITCAAMFMGMLGPIVQSTLTVLGFQCRSGFS